MYPQQEPCQDGHQACVGRVYGDSGGHPPYPQEQGNLRPEEGDHREDLRDCERTARVPLYTVYREGTDGDESRAYLCVHELKKTGKDPCQKGARGTTDQGMSTYFKEDISQDKREVLELGSDTSLCLQSAKPIGLCKYFKEHGYSISNDSSGIYHIKGPFPFPAQVIVTGELDRTSHTWLKALSVKLDKRNIQDLLEKISQMTKKR